MSSFALDVGRKVDVFGDTQVIFLTYCTLCPKWNQAALCSSAW